MSKGAGDKGEYKVLDYSSVSCCEDMGSRIVSKAQAQFHKKGFPDFVDLVFALLNLYWYGFVSIRDVRLRCPGRVVIKDKGNRGLYRAWVDHGPIGDGFGRLGIIKGTSGSGLTEVGDTPFLLGGLLFSCEDAYDFGGLNAP